MKLPRENLQAKLDSCMGIPLVYLTRGPRLVAVIMDEDLDYLVELTKAINELADQDSDCRRSVEC